MAYDIGLTKDELTRIAELGGLSWDWVEVAPGDGAGDGGGKDGPVEEGALDVGDEEPGIDVAALLHDMAEAAFSQDPDGLARLVADNRDAIRVALSLEGVGDDVAELLVLGLRVGVSRGGGAAMTELGSLFCRGDLVGQDYQAACDLYEMAAARGEMQGMVNLGYLYEHGRTGAPDYARAFECYATAAALFDSSEAVCKLGDLYARGKGVRRDLGRAHALWERSLELADDAVEQAQPAVRIAGLLVDPDYGQWGVTFDPLRALALYQAAEVGLRIDIANGQTYYQRRLHEAVEGQARARELLEGAAAPRG